MRLCRAKGLVKQRISVRDLYKVGIFSGTGVDVMGDRKGSCSAVVLGQSILSLLTVFPQERIYNLR